MITYSHILFFDFYIPSSVNINITILVSELKYLSKNMIFNQTGMSENGTIHISMKKNLVSHVLFLRKGGLTV